MILKASKSAVRSERRIQGKGQRERFENKSQIGRQGNQPPVYHLSRFSFHPLLVSLSFSSSTSTSRHSLSPPFSHLSLSSPGVIHEQRSSLLPLPLTNHRSGSSSSPHHHPNNVLHQPPLPLPNSLPRSPLFRSRHSKIIKTSRLVP